MKTYGFINYVFSLDREKRTILLSHLPPLKINRYYKQKSPIIRLVWMQQSTYKSKVIILEEIQLKKNKKELRLRYYIMGKKKSVVGKWTFGQYATFIPHKDFLKLIQLAKKYKMI